MSNSTAYSMLNVAAILDGQPVQGLFDGDDAITVTPGVDLGTMLIGADGASIFSQSADRSATISIKVQHTSATHRQLSRKAAQQRAGRLIGFPFSFMDTGSGEGGVADKCFIQTAPAVTHGI